MPRYEYVCEHCGERFERTRRIDERDNALFCPSCGEEAKREISNFAVGGGSSISSLGSVRSLGCSTGSGGG